MSNDDVLLGGVIVLLWLKYAQRNTPPDQEEDLIDTAKTELDKVQKIIDGNYPVDGMKASAKIIKFLQATERCVLGRYQLDDGGYTWGWGHYSKNPNELPLTLTQEQADAIFVKDVKERAEDVVKLFVKVPLSQNQFDALLSIAYNMSPQSFKKFAALVNQGQPIRPLAMESVFWVKEKYQNGIRKRREYETNLFESKE